MSLVFNGARQNTTTSSAALLGDSNFTVMCWVKVYSGTDAQCIVSERDIGSRQSFRLYWQNGIIHAEKTTMEFLGLSYPAYNAATPTSWPNNIYVHVAVTFSATLISLYVDGVLQATVTTANTNIDGTSNTLGARRTGMNSYDQYLNGEILDYRHYTGVMPADQISTIACTSGLDFITQNLSERHIMFGVPGVNATSLDDWSANNRDRAVSTTIPFG